MTLPVNIDAAAVVHGLMLEAADRAVIRLEVVGDNHVNVLADVLADELGECARSHVFGMEEIQVAVALADADNDLFADLAAPLNFLRAVFGVHILRLAADEGFVHFYRAIKHGAVCLAHRAADAVTEIPRRLVADAERALNLIGRHPLARLAQEIDGDEPLEQRQVRIVKDSARRDGELIVALAAVEQLLFGLKLDGLALASLALDAVRPAEAL